MPTAFFASLVLTLMQAPAPSDLPSDPPSDPSSGPVAGEPVELNQEQRASLRCSAAFALVAFGQARGNADALTWSALDERGREFFVRTAAKLIDETGATREQITEMMGQEAQVLIDEEQVHAVMPACLLMLETSGL